jgi:hypothetical protein
MATRYYEFLAGEVDVVASDQPEVVTVERIDEHQLVVEVRQAGRDHPYFTRRFRADETNEVRVYLKGGSDSALVRGSGRAPIDVKIIGGSGDDYLADESPVGRSGFFDDKGSDRSVGRGIDRRSYNGLMDSVENEPREPRRDWGRSSGFFPSIDFHSNRGFLYGIGYRKTRYGFRRIPYATRIEYRGEVGYGSGRLQFAWYRPFENSGKTLRVKALASGVEIARWYGFGNETTRASWRPTTYYQLTPLQFSVDGSIAWILAPNLDLTTGVIAKHTRADLSDERVATRFIGTDRPFGIGAMTQVGGHVGLRWEAKADPEPLTSFIRAEVEADGYPGLLDLPRPVASVGGKLAAAIRTPLPLRPTLAFQVGGERVFGTRGLIPFYEAAFLGSWSTLRGFRTHRFSGDAAVFGSAELRLQLASVPIVVPANQGIFAFYDRGRVFLSGESSSTWHSGYGGGVWLAFRRSGTILSLAASRSREGSRLYLRTGFAY